MAAIPMVILLAEDDPGHALLVKRNLLRSGIANDVIHVTDGQQAIDFIRREGKFAKRAAVGSLLVMLDMNMPCYDGMQVLERIKDDAATAKTPVIMLTTTDDPWDIERCYELGCSVYMTKPIEYEEFVEAIKRLGLLLQVVRIPAENEPQPGTPAGGMQLAN